ncbi:hypothetical protein PVK64_05230 [Aliivibrio sp. S4TY2]|uniref:hypothetical protein n=1 Tax=unclassified Aliivibrio TaxID=2645654 RepID=UPI002378F0B3|nr:MULTISPECIES: hypothetical protein [unclassified Aliivibrio]MDD9155584.1 hypothetical protein [Aliivibrio sp. S4TY2]MDD9160451.1 hypothetical protein [Aliivibrio sp. S4TY1]MDD9164651.1 hypothetical protein [Aliivibrio sp. S4MY2]MDD9168457.1 hypothetical protein [Aliivibrio sp. S4MY4]MDD9184985.1 hypothetical protein [Aliivibrio sp. S4MY3]
MNKNRFTEGDLLDSLTAYTAHSDELNEVKIGEWTEMLNQAEPISLSDDEYEKFVTALNSDPDLAALEGIKKLLKRKNTWE